MGEVKNPPAVIVVALLVIYFFIVVHAQNPIVQTSTFAVQGSVYSVNKSAVPYSEAYQASNVTQAEVYYGVPYGQSTAPPLRLENPLPVQPYTTVRNCTTTLNCPGCYIMPYYPKLNFSEDCLLSTIFRPAGTQAGAKLPVLIFIYGAQQGGGGFTIGLNLDIAPPYDYSTFINFYIPQGIIVVAIQYRAHMLGWGYDGPGGQLSGNWALFDQQLALQWVYNNIWAFGGDNTRITLLGAMSSGCMVAFHSIHPNSTAYFQNVIQLEGSYSNPVCYPSNASIPATLYVYEQLNCTDPSTRKQCLNDIPILTFIENGTNFYYTWAPTVTYGDFNVMACGTFGPSPDGFFFPPGFDLAKWAKQAPPKPTIMGVNSDSSIYVAFSYYKNWTTTNQTTGKAQNIDAAYTYSAAQLANFIQLAVVPSDWGNALAVAQIDALREDLTNFYVNKDNQANATLNYFYWMMRVRLLTDVQYVSGIWWEARQKAQLGWPIYMVHNDYTPVNAFAVVNSTFGYAYTPIFDMYPMLQDYNFLYPYYPMEPPDLLVRGLYLDSVGSFLKMGVPSSGWPRLIYNSSMQCSNTANLSMISVQPTPYLEGANNSELGERMAFYDQLALKYDFRLVHSFTNILDECLPCALRTQLISPNNNTAPLIVGLNSSFASPPLSPTGKLSFATRFSSFKTVVASNGTTAYPTPAAQINSIINTYVAWTMAGSNNSMTNDVTVMSKLAYSLTHTTSSTGQHFVDNTQISTWGTMAQFVNCGFM